MPESLVPLAGSERASLPDVTDTAPLNIAERAEITVVLRRRAELPAEIIEGTLELALTVLNWSARRPPHPVFEETVEMDDCHSCC